VRLKLRAALAASSALLLLTGLAAAVPTRAPAATSVPALKHVFIIVLENEDFSASWGPNSPAAYLNHTLLPQGAFADNYYGVSHLSADNYIAMTSGQTPTPVFQADCQNWSSCYLSEKARLDGGRSIADQLEARNLTWGAYMDSMPVPCDHPALTDLNDPNSKGYATRHNPFVYYPPIVDDQARCEAHVRPYTDLPPRLASSNAADVPNYVFISPDTCNDGHDAPCADGRPGGLTSADAWLQANVPLILNSAAYKDNGALFITFDEASNQDVSGCCASGMSGNGLDGGGHVGLLMLSPLGKVGHATDTFYDHHSLLRTVEDGFGITEHLNNAASPKEKAMSDLFL
jgi:hypothetical protein